MVYIINCNPASNRSYDRKNDLLRYVKTSFNCRPVVDYGVYVHYNLRKKMTVDL